MPNLLSTRAAFVTAFGALLSVLDSGANEQSEGRDINWGGRESSMLAARHRDAVGTMLGHLKSQYRTICESSGGVDAIIRMLVDKIETQRASALQNASQDLAVEINRRYDQIKGLFIQVEGRPAPYFSADQRVEYWGHDFRETFAYLFLAASDENMELRPKVAKQLRQNYQLSRRIPMDQTVALTDPEFLVYKKEVIEEFCNIQFITHLLSIAAEYEHAGDGPSCTMGTFGRMIQQMANMNIATAFVESQRADSDAAAEALPGVIENFIIEQLRGEAPAIQMAVYEYITGVFTGAYDPELLSEDDRGRIAQAKTVCENFFRKLHTQIQAFNTSLQQTPELAALTGNKQKAIQDAFHCVIDEMQRLDVATIPDFNRNFLERLKRPGAERCLEQHVHLKWRDLRCTLRSAELDLQAVSAIFSTQIHRLILINSFGESDQTKMNDSMAKIRALAPFFESIRRHLTELQAAEARFEEFVQVSVQPALTDGIGAAAEAHAAAGVNGDAVLATTTSADKEKFSARIAKIASEMQRLGMQWESLFHAGKPSFGALSLLCFQCQPKAITTQHIAQEAFRIVFSSEMDRGAKQSALAHIFSLVRTPEARQQIETEFLRLLTENPEKFFASDLAEVKSLVESVFKNFEIPLAFYVEQIKLYLNASQAMSSEERLQKRNALRAFISSLEVGQKQELCLALSEMFWARFYDANFSWGQRKEFILLIKGLPVKQEFELHYLTDLHQFTTEVFERNFPSEHLARLNSAMGVSLHTYLAEGSFNGLIDCFLAAFPAYDQKTIQSLTDEEHTAFIQRIKAVAVMTLMKQLQITDLRQMDRKAFEAICDKYLVRNIEEPIVPKGWAGQLPCTLETNELINARLKKLFNHIGKMIRKLTEFKMQFATGHLRISTDEEARAIVNKFLNNGSDYHFFRVGMSNPETTAAYYTGGCVAGGERVKAGIESDLQAGMASQCLCLLPATLFPQAGQAIRQVYAVAAREMEDRYAPVGGGLGRAAFVRDQAYQAAGVCLPFTASLAAVPVVTAPASRLEAEPKLAAVPPPIEQRQIPNQPVTNKEILETLSSAFAQTHPPLYKAIKNLITVVDQSTVQNKEDLFHRTIELCNSPDKAKYAGYMELAIKYADHPSTASVGQAMMDFGKACRGYWFLLGIPLVVGLISYALGAMCWSMGASKTSDVMEAVVEAHEEKVSKVAQT